MLRDVLEKKCGGTSKLKVSGALFKESRLVRPHALIMLLKEITSNGITENNAAALCCWIICLIHTKYAHAYYRGEYSIVLVN